MVLPRIQRFPDDSLVRHHQPASGTTAHVPFQCAGGFRGEFAGDIGNQYFGMAFFDRAIHVVSMCAKRARNVS